MARTKAREMTDKEVQDSWDDLMDEIDRNIANRVIPTFGEESFTILYDGMFEHSLNQYTIIPGYGKIFYNGMLIAEDIEGEIALMRSKYISWAQIDSRSVMIYSDMLKEGGTITVQYQYDSYYPGRKNRKTQSSHKSKVQVCPHCTAPVVSMDPFCQYCHGIL